MASRLNDMLHLMSCVMIWHNRKLPAQTCISCFVCQGMASSRAHTDFKLAREAADEAAESARIIAELEADIAADGGQEDPVLVEAEAVFLQAQQRYEAAKAAATAAKVLSR